MHLGTCKVDITPESPVPLAGFASRLNRPYEKVASRLYARIAYFRQEEGEHATTQALFVSADLIWWGSDRLPGLLQMMQQRWGFAAEQVIFHGTHSHSGPQTSDCFHPLLGAMDTAYIEMLEQRLMDGIEKAIKACEPVRLERGETDFRYGVYRRGWWEGQPGLVDPEVTVIRCISETSHNETLFVHYTCHPVITQDPYVSAEFTGVAMNEVEQASGKGLSFFIQGCCGDTNIDLTSFGLESAARGSEEHVAAIGKKLADAVKIVLAQPMRELRPTAINAHAYTVDLPLRPMHSREALLEMTQAEEPRKSWAQRALAQEGQHAATIPLCMNRLDLAEEWSLLTFNAEVVVEYGLYVKQQSGKRILPVPYSNGMFGYVPTASQIRAGGYEPEDSAYYFNMPGLLDEQVETTLKRCLQQIIDS